MDMPYVVWCGPMGKTQAKAYKRKFDTTSYSLQYGETARPHLKVVEKSELTPEQLRDLRFIC